ncbi:hypothetical protein [Entomomonas moraniae]|nr:hypothetical protein [Entomomonas moraniae]
MIKLIKRIIIIFLLLCIIVVSGYLSLRGFYNARYYQHYIESPVFAWNQMRTVELAGIPSDAFNEVNLNAKVMVWSYNQERIDWLIRLFRFNELASKEKENHALLCDLQAYRKKHPMIGNYYDSLFPEAEKPRLYKQQREDQENYIKTLTQDWQKILALPCGVKS